MYLKPKLHQLWRIALWLGKLQLSVFLKIVWVFWLECVVHALVNNSFWINLTVFGLFRYSHFVIKSRATCPPKSRCQSDLSTVSVLANRNLRQDLMYSGCRGTADPNVCLRAFSLFPLPSSPLDQRPDRLDGEENAGTRHSCENEQQLEKEIDKEIHKLKYFLDQTDELIKLRDYTEMDIANRRAGKIVGNLSDLISQAEE